MFTFYRQYSILKIYFITKRLPVAFSNISLSWIAYYYTFNFLLVVNFTSYTPVPLISPSPHIHLHIRPCNLLTKRNYKTDKTTNKQSIKST